jgi:hypothetical protein
MGRTWLMGNQTSLLSFPVYNETATDAGCCPTEQSMTAWFHRFEEARRHVAEGRQIISRQRDLVAGLRDRGQSTVKSAQLLAPFECIQEAFEDDLESIEQDADSTTLTGSWNATVSA